MHKYDSKNRVNDDLIAHVESGEFGNRPRETLLIDVVVSVLGVDVFDVGASVDTISGTNVSALFVPNPPNVGFKHVPSHSWRV